MLTLLAPPSSSTGNPSYDNAAPEPLPSQFTGTRWWAIQDSNQVRNGTGASVCAPFSGGACCSATYMNVLATQGPGGLYPNYSYDQCGQRNTSNACKRFLSQQECSYSCDPFLAARYSSFYTDPATFVSIPLCATMCEDWFDACHDDYTCVENWQSWDNAPDIATNGFICPLGSPCRTFAQTYGSAQNMCNIMWGNVYTYSTNLDTWCGAGVAGGSAAAVAQETHALEQRGVQRIVISPLLPPTSPATRFRGTALETATPPHRRRFPCPPHLRRVPTPRPLLRRPPRHPLAAPCPPGSTSRRGLWAPSASLCSQECLSQSSRALPVRAGRRRRRRGKPSQASERRSSSPPCPSRQRRESSVRGEC